MKKTLILRSYATSKEFSLQAKTSYDVKSVRFQKKTLRKIEIEPSEYEYYKRLLCRNKNPLLNVMLKHQVATQMKHMRKLQNQRIGGRSVSPRQISQDKPKKPKKRSLQTTDFRDMIKDASFNQRKNSLSSLNSFKRNSKFAKNRMSSLVQM